MGDLREKMRLEIDLPVEQVKLIDDAVRDGSFTSRADAIAHAIDTWRSSHALNDYTDEELGRLWDEGIASGEPIPAEEAFQRLREKFSKRLRTDEAKNPA